jgi:hypothetical protein
MRAVVAAAVLAVPAIALGATVAHGWIGTYQTKQTQLISAAMSDNYLTITRMSGGGIRFTFQAASAGCLGKVDFDASKLPRGHDVVLSTNPEDGSLCIMRLHHEGDTIVAAEDGCDQFHGMECTFSGSYGPEKHR